jgi:ubiquitin-conjugating enzyme E2 O
LTFIDVNMAACTIFEEDEVSIFTPKGPKYGLVLESSEYVSSSDEEDHDSDEEFERIRKGTVRVAWHPDGKEQVISENKVRTLIYVILSSLLKDLEI